jgi:phage terminase large subunit
VRDFGLSWLAVFISVWMWSTWDEAPAVGFGSQKEELVDVRGDPKTLFEKIRMAIRGLPPFLQPDGLDERAHLTERKCENPVTGATIIGEIGANIGRGGRTLLYWKDEAAHYLYPDMIEAALGDNTNVQIDISTPNGLGNVFHRRRKTGRIWTTGRRYADRCSVGIHRRLA